MAHDEFIQFRLGFLPLKSNPGESFESFDTLADKPKSKDWRDNKFVTLARNQGYCNSGYIFAPTATLESHYAKEHSSSTPPYISDQNFLRKIWPL